MSDRAKTVGQVVAGRVTRYRRERGWSQQRLADEMSELGYPINRVTLAKLESGVSRESRTRAENVPLREVLVLAAALNVPPVLLFIPLGEDDLVELTPNSVVHPHVALEWVIGEGPFARRNKQGRTIAHIEEGWNDRAAPVMMWHELRRLNADLDHRWHVWQGRVERGDPAAAEAQSSFDVALGAVLQHRRYMAPAERLNPPPQKLPPLPEAYAKRAEQLEMLHREDQS